MLGVIPKLIFFTKGIGVHKDRLQSFELALRHAGIQHLNLVMVSSIVPPGCVKISRNLGLKLVKPGQITFCVIARNETNEPGRLVAASIGMALPAEKAVYGYLSEHHSFGENAKTAGDYAEDLAATMLATTLGISFDPDKACDEREQIFKASGKVIRTSNTTQVGRGNPSGWWTTVLAIAVMLA